MEHVETILLKSKSGSALTELVDKLTKFSEPLLSSLDKFEFTEKPGAFLSDGDSEVEEVVLIFRYNALSKDQLDEIAEVKAAAKSANSIEMIVTYKASSKDS